MKSSNLQTRPKHGHQVSGSDRARSLMCICTCAIGHYLLPAHWAIAVVSGAALLTAATHLTSGHSLTTRCPGAQMFRRQPCAHSLRTPRFLRSDNLCTGKLPGYNGCLLSKEHQTMHADGCASMCHTEIRDALKHQNLHADGCV
eukprot:1143502-Pelagomonas_calceolata.AAC.3